MSLLTNRQQTLGDWWQTILGYLSSQQAQELMALLSAYGKDNIRATIKFFWQDPEIFEGWQLVKNYSYWGGRIDVYVKGGIETVYCAKTDSYIPTIQWSAEACALEPNGNGTPPPSDWKKYLPLILGITIIGAVFYFQKRQETK